jgi:hypothetical protein
MPSGERWDRAKWLRPLIECCLRVIGPGDYRGF